MAPGPYNGAMAGGTEAARGGQAGGKWRPPAGHALAALEGLALGPCRLAVLLGPKNNVGSTYFRLLLRDATGREGEPDVALGLHSSGPLPAYNWLELVRYEPAVTFGPTGFDLRASGAEGTLFAALSALVPPGGHLMVEYDSPAQTETARGLALGFPPAATPLGYLLFQAGCRSFRDWYISEGGREGPRKLQGFKPLDEAIAREKCDLLRREIESFLARGAPPAHGRLEAGARDRARRVLAALGGE